MKKLKTDSGDITSEMKPIVVASSSDIASASASTSTSSQEVDRSDAKTNQKGNMGSDDETKSTSESKEEKKKRKKQRLMDKRFSPSKNDQLQPTNHEREERPTDLSLLPRHEPQPERIYFSYFYQQHDINDVEM